MMTEPIQRDLERYGTPDGRADPEPTCPVCGRETEVIYVRDGDPVGCDRCVKKVDIWDFEEGQNGGYY